MGGGGKQPQASKTLERNSEQLFKDSTPVRQTLLNQTMEALSTGGVNAQIPLIQRMTENAKASNATAERQTEGSLGSSGLAGTPFGQAILAGMRQQGGAQVAGIGPQVASSFASGAPNLALGFPQIAGSGLANAGQMQGQAKGQQLSLISQFMGGAKPPFVS